MNVCYFGDYDPEYSRNRVLLRGLKLNGVSTTQCNTSLTGIAAIKDLIMQFSKLNIDFDYFIVGYSGSRFIVPLLKILTNKPIIWDVFFSSYENYALERKYINKFSLKAFIYWFLDWFNCQLADKVILDTEEHIKYFVKLYKISQSKFVKILVGTDDSIFFPGKKLARDDKFVIHFHGNIIPLQGFQYILEAAKILQSDKQIVFQFIGRKSRIDKVINKENITNITILDKVPYNELPKYMQLADICLGIFGDTDKTTRVIPNKVYEAAAMAKPIITADTPAIRELFTDREDILLCKRADPKDLADKILLLKNNIKLRKSIAAGGYKVYQIEAMPQILGSYLKQIF